ncbi:MAG: hypothetical protein RR942_15065 [Romboutsia sp.]
MKKLRKLNRKDLVRYETGDICTVLKTYVNEEGEQYVQALSDIGLVYNKIECFEPMDAMLLRCNSCSLETYETDLDVNEDNQMYTCDCGSSTFTPLNIDLEELENY